MTEPDKSIKKVNPTWFKVINLLFLIPIIVWPLVFFMTIFFFDNPKSFLLTLLLFLAVNAYPLYLIILLLINARLFRRTKLLATLFPIAFCLTFIFLALNFFGGLTGVAKVWRQIGSEPTNSIDYENVLGFNYRKDSLHIYYGDSLLGDADVKSFELINFSWAKDKNRVYYHGRPVSTIDSKTFRYLDYHYSLDTNYVFYDSTVIKGADAATFRHISGTQDGKDNHNCYRYGENVDCSVLLTDDE